MVTKQIQTTEDQIDSKEKRQTHHTEIKILRKKTISEDLIDSKEDRQMHHTELKTLMK